MGLLEKIGLKKKREEPKPESIEAGSKEEETAKKIPGRKRSARARSLAYRILIRPVLSEKATHLASSGKYVFAVYSEANKQEVKKSIQQIYEVHVRSVKIVKMPGKLRRHGRTFGRTSNWKKAIVTVKEGEKIPGIIEAVG